MLCLAKKLGDNFHVANLDSSLSRTRPCEDSIPEMVDILHDFVGVFISVADCPIQKRQSMPGVKPILISTAHRGYKCLFTSQERVPARCRLSWLDAVSNLDILSLKYIPLMPFWRNISASSKAQNEAKILQYMAVVCTASLI